MRQAAIDREVQRELAWRMANNRARYAIRDLIQAQNKLGAKPSNPQVAAILLTYEKEAEAAMRHVVELRAQEGKRTARARMMKKVGKFFLGVLRYYLALFFWGRARRRRW